MACLIEEPEPWLAKQLKLTREQLGKKSHLCDQMATELRRLEGDLEARNEAAREARNQLRMANNEARAQALANAEAQAAYEEEVASLRAEAETLRAVVAAPGSPSAVPTPRLSEAVVDGEALQKGTPAVGSATEAAPAALADTSPERDSALASMEAAAATARREAEELRVELQRYRELSEAAANELRMVQDLGDSQVTELKEELQEVATGLEDKEEEVYNIQFEMAALQTHIQDQAAMVIANAEAFQQASEELADKDERLEKAIQRQEELLAQMNSVSEQLQKKVTGLSQELQSSRTAYQTLEEQTRGVVKRLENDREHLTSELVRVRSVAAAEAEVQVAEKLASLEDELQKARETAATELAEVKAALAAATSRAKAAEDEAELAREEVGTSLRPLLADRDGPAVMHRAAKPIFGRTLSTLSVASPSQLATAEGQFAAAEERLMTAEIQVADLQSALARSRLVEQQATERAQEYRTCLELYKEFGAEGWLLAPTAAEPAGPTSPLGTGTMEKLRSLNSGISMDEDVDGHVGSATNLAPPGEVALPSVLIALELDLGMGTATLRVAPWQTTEDFSEIVREFLVENRVKMVFADALVRYLEEVETQAQTFPAFVKADLADIYGIYA